MTRNFKIIFFASIALLAACSSALPNDEADRLITNDFFGIDLMVSPIRAIRAMDRNGLDFIDIMNRSVPLLKEAGISIVGFDILWEEIQLSKGHSYNWGALDKIMKILHNNRIKAKITFYPASTWACKKAKEVGHHRNWEGPVKPQYFAQWCKVVQAVVERYDGDGAGDAFKMDYPVLWLLQVSAEIESPKHWLSLGGSYKEYDDLLNFTFKCVKKANNLTLVGRAALNFGRLFEKDIDKPLRVEDIRDKKAKSFMHFFISSIEEEDDYDLFGIQFNHSWKGIISQVEWITKYLRKCGYIKPMYCNHARSTEVGHSEKLKILRNLKHPRYEETRETYYAIQASTIIKKLTVALATGIRYIVIACFFDFPKLLTEGPVVDEGYSGVQWALTGILNTDALIAGKKHVAKPAYYSYKLFIDKIAGVEKNVKQHSMGKGIWAFEFIKDNKSIYVLWRHGSEKDFKGPLEKVSFPVRLDKAQVTRIITQWGKKTPEVETIPVNNGLIEVKVGEIPIFLEEATQK